MANGGCWLEAAGATEESTESCFSAAGRGGFASQNPPLWVFGHWPAAGCVAAVEEAQLKRPPGASAGLPTSRFGLLLGVLAHC